MITRLFFADEIHLFAHANSREAYRIMATLKNSQISFGQVVNLDKSEASYS